MPLDESLGNLVNDLTEQILQRVQTQVQAVIADAVDRKLNEVLTPTAVSTVIAARVNQSIQNYQPDMTELETRLIESGNRIVDEIDKTASKRISNLITDKVNAIKMEPYVQEFVARTLTATGKHINLGDNCIPGSAIDKSGLRISADNIDPGTMKKFASTGIDDQASKCQVTVMDAGTVFENTLYSPRLEVKGDAVIDGDLLIKGTIPKNSQTYLNIVKDSAESVRAHIGPELLDQHQNRVYERIAQEGISLSKLTVDGKLVLEGTRLTNAILDSQLQTVGVLKDLQTQGETLLSETLYASGRRVGVNTMDPGSALSVWDEEVEIGIGKQKANTARIATSRDQVLVLGANKQNNITLTPDGVAEIPQLQIGKMLFTSAPSAPNYTAPSGVVVFNENPSLGGPLGWVSLGDARWANFGIID